jgi:hypothetical protein
MWNAHLCVVAPCAVDTGNFMCHVVFDQPIEGAVQGYTVKAKALLLGEVFDFLMRKRGSGFE